MLFPACAGVIQGVPGGHSLSFAFPRTFGGDPHSERGGEKGLNFSPHVRGLREGVTGSAAADAFLLAADPLQAAP